MDKRLPKIVSAVAVSILAIWTAGAHVLWRRGDGVLHGIVAFFLGLLVLIVIGAVIRVYQGIRKTGARWLVSREGLRVYGWTVLFAVSAIALFYAVESWRGKRAWAGAVEQAKALGEPLSYTAIIPPPVPDEENFAKAPIFRPLFGEAPNQGKHLVFTQRLTPPRKAWHARELPWLNQERVDVHAWAEYYTGTNLPGISEEAAATKLLEAFTRYTGVLDEVRQFSTRPHCQFPMPYGEHGTGSYLVPMRDLIRLLGERASAELILDRGNEGFADARLALRLAAYSRKQLTAFGSRLNLVLEAIQPVWEGLGSRRWNEQQITELQNQLQALNWLSDYPMAVRMDRLYLAAIIETMVPTTETKVPTMELGMSARERGLLEFVIPVGWSLQDQAVIHRFHFDWTAQRVDPTKARLIAPLKGQSLKLTRSSDPFFPVFISPMLRHIAEEKPKDFAFAQTTINLATLACALERHRLARGSYPEKLEALLPEYAEALPHDIITGEPLKYRRPTGDEFILYSVGLNGVDDGGKPAPREKDWEGRWRPMPDLRKGDWVWRYSRPGER